MDRNLSIFLQLRFTWLMAMLTVTTAMQILLRRKQIVAVVSEKALRNPMKP
jgi:hypothetical protein